MQESCNIQLINLILIFLNGLKAQEIQSVELSDAGRSCGVGMSLPAVASASWYILWLQPTSFKSCSTFVALLTFVLCVCVVVLYFPLTGL